MAEHDEKLELLVLLLIHGSKTPPTLNEAREALKTVLAHLGAAGAKTALKTALESSVSAGSVAAEGKLAPRFRLTRHGQGRLEAEFGPLPKASWPALRDRLLIPRSMSRPGQNVSAELKSFPALRNALALEAVGLEYRPRTTPVAALNRIAAKAAGAVRSDATAIKTAVLRRWLTPPAPPANTQPGAHPSASFNLEDFVSHVRSAMTRIPGGRWDGAKVFVNWVWRQLVAEGNDGGLDLDAFKAHLLEANRRGLLRLSRADLVSAMPPDDVRESEIPSFGDVFHFIQP